MTLCSYRPPRRLVIAQYQYKCCTQKLSHKRQIKVYSLDIRPLYTNSYHQADVVAECREALPLLSNAIGFSHSLMSAALWFAADPRGPQPPHLNHHHTQHLLTSNYPITQEALVVYSVQFIEYLINK